MARCCGNNNCSCVMVGSGHVRVEGSGSTQDPFKVIGDVDLNVVDTTLINLTRTGQGTITSPWQISATFAPTASVKAFPDWSDTAPTNGQVPKWDNATGMWVPGAPTTAAAGTVASDNSIDGDGSSGAPLAVAHDTARFTATASGGIGLTNTGVNSLVRRFTNATARTAATIAPALNTVSMLDTEPGSQDYWTGTAWRKVRNGQFLDVEAQFLAMSGSYPTDAAVYTVIRQVTATTDGSGVFDVLAPADLTGRAGVLSLSFQESGSTPYKAMPFANVDRVSATAYRLDTGAVYSSQQVSGTVTATCY